MACGTSPVWYPLGQKQIQIYDEAGSVGLIEAHSFPLACGRVAVGSSVTGICDDVGVSTMARVVGLPPAGGFREFAIDFVDAVAESAAL